MTIYLHTTLYNSCALPNKCFVTLLKSVPFKASKFNNVMQNVHVLFMIMLMLINCQFNDPKPHNNCLPQSDNWTETLKKTPRLTPLYRCVIYNAMHVAFTIKVQAKCNNIVISLRSSNNSQVQNLNSPPVTQHLIFGWLRKVLRFRPR